MISSEHKYMGKHNWFSNFNESLSFSILSHPIIILPQKRLFLSSLLFLNYTKIIENANIIPNASKIF